MKTIIIFLFILISSNCIGQSLSERYKNVVEFYTYLESLDATDMERQNISYIVYNNGDKYLGQVSKSGKKDVYITLSGYGIYMFADGSMLSSKFKNSKPTGLGYQYHEGLIFEVNY